MKAQVKFDTFSLAEVFNQTRMLQNVSMLVENDDHSVSTYHAHTDWLTIHEHVTHQISGYVERIALRNDADGGNLILARLKSGLYRVVGFNAGHGDGAFKRHDKRRLAKRESEKSREVLGGMFDMAHRVHGSTELTT